LIDNFSLEDALEKETINQLIQNKLIDSVHMDQIEEIIDMVDSNTKDAEEAIKEIKTVVEQQSFSPQDFRTWKKISAILFGFNIVWLLLFMLSNPDSVKNSVNPNIAQNTATNKAENNNPVTIKNTPTVPESSSQAKKSGRTRQKSWTKSRN